MTDEMPIKPIEKRKTGMAPGAPIVRETRESETREVTERKKVWLPPERLPKYKIEGYHLRWIRRELRGGAEDSNVLSRIRQGFEPVRPEEVGAYDVTTMEDGRWAGVIISGDLMLMKQPIEMKEQRDAFYHEKTDKAQRAVDAQLEENQNSKMPVSRSVQTSTTVGRPTVFQKDD